MMTNEAKKAKILAAIEARGWWIADLYLREARELQAAGLVKLDHRYTAVGDTVTVWVAA